jgi:DNA-binding CsgD family transcriptional regulator
MEKNMHSLQPQSLTNNELERLAYITGYDKLPTNWIAEILHRTEKDRKTERPHNPDQLELDLS